MDLATPIGFASLGLAAIYTVILFSALAQRLRITWLIPAIFFLLALMRVRNAPPFAIAAVLTLPDMLPHSRLAKWLNNLGWVSIKGGGPAIGRHARAGRGHDAAKPGYVFAILYNFLFPLILVCMVLTIQSIKVSLPVIGSGWARFDSAHWPIDLLAELRELNESGSATPWRIFNDFEFGGFLIYHTPNLKVFVDGRCPLYGSEFLFAYTSARQDNPQQISDWQRQYQFQYALVEAGCSFDAYLQRSGRWTLIGRCEAAALYRIRLVSPADID